jgi:hypothetical protein
MPKYDANPIRPVLWRGFTLHSSVYLSINSRISRQCDVQLIVKSPNSLQTLHGDAYDMTKYLLSLVRHQLQASTLLGFHQRVSSRACRPALILNRKLSIKQNKSGPRASSHLAASLDPQTIYNPAGKHKNSNKTIRNQFQYTLLFSNPTKLVSPSRG